MDDFQEKAPINTGITCPSCGSNNITIQVVNESILKNKHHSFLWWICIGWWFVSMMWFIFFIPKIFIKLFGLGHKKQKIINKTIKKVIETFCAY